MTQKSMKDYMYKRAAMSLGSGDGKPLTSPIATPEEQATLNRANAVKKKAAMERAAGINYQATRQQEQAYGDSTMAITKKLAERTKIARRKPSTMYKKN